MKRHHLLRAAMALVAVIALYGCAPEGEPVTAELPSPAEALTVQVTTRPAPPRSAEPLTWVVQVTNSTQEAIDLPFDTTQRGDVFLEYEGSRIYTWSRGRAFPLRPNRVAIAPGQTVSFELEDDVFAVGPGEYDLFATVNSTPGLASQRTTIRVEAPAR